MNISSKGQKQEEASCSSTKFWAGELPPPGADRPLCDEGGQGGGGSFPFLCFCYFQLFFFFFAGNAIFFKKKNDPKEELGSVFTFTATSS